MHLLSLRPRRTLPPLAPATFSRALHSWLVFCFTLLAVTALAQTTGPGGGPVVIGPGGGGGGGPTTGGPTTGDPTTGGSDGGPTVIGPGGGSTITEPTLLAPRGALLGETVTASVLLPAPSSGSAPATYQWTVTGAQASSAAKSSTFEFIANRLGAVSLAVSGLSNGTAYNLTADLTVISATTAGKITVPATVSAGTASFSASVPPAQNTDRTFRWSVSGDAAIASGQSTASVTLRPGSPGTKELTCAVNLQELVTVQLRSLVVVTGDGAPVLVTVERGSGGGTYPAGSRVDLFAHAPVAGQVFHRWTGDTAALESSAATTLTSPHLVLTVPSRPVTLTATYTSAPAWSPTTVAAFGGNGVALSYFFPTAARGLVVLLHDRGADAGAWFARPEAALLTRHLVAAGYGVAALSSSDRSATATWATTTTAETNADLRHHAAALDKFTRENLLPSSHPVFLLGFGTGATAAGQFAHALATGSPARPIAAVALLGAAGSETLAVTSRLPHFFALPSGSDPSASGGLAAARTHAQLLLGRGHAAETFTFARAPVYADRLRMLGVTSPDFTAADAQTIWTALRNADLLDANSHVPGTPDLDDVTAALPASHRARAADVTAQLTLGRAGAELASECAARLIAFLDARTAAVPGPVPGRLVNLSVRTRIAFVGDSFTAGFTLTGPARATILIRGIGPGLAAFGLDTALAAPRLEVHRSSGLIATNEGWDQGTNASALSAAAASVGAFALAPGGLDTAALLTLDPGSHTVTIKGVNGASGDALVEVYDVSRNATRLTNLSALGKINAEGDLLVPGIVLLGANPRTIVARAVGPGLGELGLDAAALLGDPRIALLGSNGTTLRSNQNWSIGSSAALTAAFPLVGAFPLKANSADAALIEALAPGSYTLQVAAAALPPTSSATPPSLTGTVLVELYEVP